MSRKRDYPGGFRLTLKTARALALRELGTTKGLKQEAGSNAEGFYVMELGNLEVKIHPDMSGSGCIELTAVMFGGNGRIFQLYDRNTLERNYDEESIHKKRERREAFEEWVSCNGPELCHKVIDDFWNK